MSKVYAEGNQRNLIQDIYEGELDGHDIFSQVAKVDILTALQDVGSDGGIRAYGATATLSIVSTSANDANAGTGVQSVRVVGLVDNAGTLEQSFEDIILNGLTPVVSTKTFSRIFQLFALKAGATGAAVGDIVITLSANQSGKIQAGQTTAFSSHYTTPDDVVAYLTKLEITTGFECNSQIEMLTRDNQTADAAFVVAGSWAVNDDSQNSKDFFIRIPNKTDIVFRAVNNTAPAGQAAISINYDLIIVSYAESIAIQTPPPGQGFGLGGFGITPFGL